MFSNYFQYILSLDKKCFYKIYGVLNNAENANIM